MVGGDVWEMTETEDILLLGVNTIGEEDIAEVVVVEAYKAVTDILE